MRYVNFRPLILSLLVITLCLSGKCNFSGSHIDGHFNPRFNNKSAALACPGTNKLGTLSINTIYDNTGAVAGSVLQPGLDRARTIKVSPDGKNLYATAFNDGTLLVFDRNTNTGVLTINQIFDDNGAIPGSITQNGLTQADVVAVSPDGKHVYATGRGSDALLVFNRNMTTGSLTLNQIFSNTGAIPGSIAQDGLDGAIGVIVSKDGNNVYVSGVNDNTLIVFNRNTTTGQLTLNQVFDEVGAVGGSIVQDGLGGAAGINESPDGAHIFVSAFNDNALLVFSRNSSTGSLTIQQIFNDTGAIAGSITQDGITNAGGVSLSPSGESLYIIGFGDNALLVFDRNTSTGNLTFNQMFQDTGAIPGSIAHDGLSAPNGILVSRDGKTLYVSGRDDDALSVFDRNTSTGQLTANQIFDNTGLIAGSIPLDGLDGALTIAESPDCESLYISGSFDDTILFFDRL